MKFQVIDEAQKKCMVGTNTVYQCAVDQSINGGITIPDKINGYNVVKIGGMSFFNCQGINSISIPNTIVDMEQWGIFNNCDNLGFIYSYIEKPTEMSSDAFMLSDYSEYSNATLYVPYGTRSNYESVVGWKNLKNIVEMAPHTFEITVPVSGYATFFDYQSAYKLPWGLSAQVVTNAGNNKLTYKTIADGSVSGIIPAGTAVMLVSDSKQSVTYTLTATESSTTYSGTNLLRGSDEATTTTGEGYHYKLSYGRSGSSQSDVFGWYWGAQNGGAFQIEGHKAWLVVPRSATRSDGFNIDGEATGITAVEAETEAIYYDLQGRRIEKPAAKGVYIVNGKKVMVK